MSLSLQGPWTLHLSLLLALLTLVSLTIAQESLQAQIGIEIKSGTQISWARANDRAQAGDFLRIHVAPAQPSYVYVVYTDGKEVILLNSQEHQKQLKQGDTLILPGQDQFYQISAGSTGERFTIICSRETIKELLDIPVHGMSPHKWAVLEEKYTKAGEVNLGSDIEKPMSTAGNTRGLKNFSGKSLLVKKYEFQVAQ